MRLLIDCTPLHSGGGVQVAVGVLQGLAGTSLVWQAIVPEPVMRQFPENLQAHSDILRVPKRGRMDFFRLSASCRQAEAGLRPDLVFTVFGPAYFKARTRHLVGFALPNLVYPPAEGLPAQGMAARCRDLVRRQMVRRADHLVVETESFAERTSTAIGFDRAKIHVVRNAVNPLLEHHHRTLPVPGCAQILVPAAFYPHKNLGAIPATAAALAEKCPALDFKFQLTLDASGEGWAKIASAAAQLGVSERVETLGVLPLAALAQAYQDCALVFLPTLREASTAVYPEAFHFGRPLVTTDIDFAHDLCGDAAIFVDPYRADAMAAAIASVIDSPERRDYLVAAGIAQLARAYPDAKSKFAAQLRLFEEVCMR